MAKLDLGGIMAADAGEGSVQLPKAAMGAVGGAFALALVYGVVGRFVGEFSYIAFLIGAASGVGALKLGGGRSVVAGGIAAAATLAAVLFAKVIVGAPEGVSWLSYHTQMFDIIFCYVAAPVAAFAAASTDQARQLLKKLPV